MANYTMTLMEILQQNMKPGMSLNNINDVYELASTCLFNNTPVNVINDEYRQNFIIGFTLHFLKDEIGLETLPLWQIALTEKVVNNAAYINNFYWMLHKQIFSDYTVERRHITNDQMANNTGKVNSKRNVSEKGNEQSDREMNTLNNTEGKIDETSTINTSNVHGEQNQDITSHSGNTTTSEGGYQVTDHTGTVSEKRNIDVAGTRDVTLEHDGGDKYTETRNLKSTESGGYTDKTDQTVNGKTSDRVDNNVISYNFDTPMNSLKNMRDPGGSAAGKGVGYAAENTYNYMSSANEQDGTNVTTHSSDDKTVGVSTRVFDNHNTADTGTVEHDASMSHFDENTSDVNKSSQNENNVTTYGDANKLTRDLTTTNKITDTNSLEQIRSGTDNTNQSNTTAVTNTNTENGNVKDRQVVNNAHQTSDNMDLNKLETNNTNAVEDGEIETFHINWEMIYRSIPLLDKLWATFDDIFMKLL